MSVPGSHEARGVSGRERDEQIRDALREYADAVDKDRGFETGLTRTMRDAADKLGCVVEQPVTAGDGRAAATPRPTNRAALAEGSAAQDGDGAGSRPASAVAPHVPDSHIAPTGDERCGFIRDRCRCLLPKDHADDLHRCAHGVWRDPTSTHASEGSAAQEETNDG